MVFSTPLEVMWKLFYSITCRYLLKTYAEISNYFRPLRSNLLKLHCLYIVSNCVNIYDKLNYLNLTENRNIDEQNWISKNTFNVFHNDTIISRYLCVIHKVMKELKNISKKKNTEKNKSSGTVESGPYINWMNPLKCISRR